ncbi:Butyryl-CoA dehydrogenase [Desulfofundulus kuznetsovii DSM 6115]|uniref:Butyryl-CoA dehydrogenase n=1 Tax=Desulfofundulus kuznetsovii (strain DSM 6115 / VKM B-1805 / 17) TaxID=760568 RepID=A0AAU8P884_DESK7|nr:Butyryl-CoA dehydrogenase [Desulfofundulus kuznetsovii DSM 6115]
MDFSIPDEIRDMKRTLRNFVDNEVEKYSQQIEEEDKIPQYLIDKAKEMGLFGMSIPEEYGGLGLSMVERCLLLEELGRANMSFTTYIGAHTGIGTTGIVELGSEEIKQKYLPAMASGEKLGAFALTEPDAGSDATNIKTTAVLKGDKWILNGRKHFITNAPEADIFTVIAVTDREKGARGGFTAFVVEKDFPGFSIGTIEKKMGLRGSHTAEVIFEDCEVPVENVLGEVGRGYASALKILSKGRVALAARCVGACDKLVELSARYAQQRIQFGKPIASFQAIQWMLAEMATDTEAARALTYRVAWMVDQGLPVIKEGPMVKLFASEALGRVVDKAVQIHGGMGYMKDFPVERFYRDARITRIYEGTNEIQRMIIANRLLKEFEI